MTAKKGFLQKLSLVSAVASFALAIISGVMLYLQSERVGSDNPVSASLMASMFFFVCVGIILFIIGNADIPSFKFDDSKDK
jgi:tetrahydromethanopterin S-methyltransferase subunit D